MDEIFSQLEVCSRYLEAALDRSQVTTSQREYCPPLDPALLSAIVLDFDLSNETAVATARKTLGALKESAVEEENTTFDPSGTSSHIEPDEGDVSFNRAVSVPDIWALRSQGTDLTSVFNGLHSLDIASELESEFSEGSENARENLAAIHRLNNTTKITLLKGMFPNATDLAISQALQISKGCWNKTIEELLNSTFFDAEVMKNGDDRIMAKGVDAFTDDNTVRSGRRKRDLRRSWQRGVEEGQRAISLPTTVTINGAENPWQRRIKDIDLISSNVQVSKNTVSSLYHQNGASVAAIISALRESKNIPNHTARIGSSDPVVQAQAYKLGIKFPSIPSTILTDVVCLTHPSTAAAHELAKRLAHELPANTRGNLQVITRYASLNLSEESPTQDWSIRLPHALPRPSNPTSTIIPSAQATISSLIDDFISAQTQNIGVGRSGEIDLHGMSVKDAVRIARLCTQSWWQSRQGIRVVGLDGRVVRDGEGDVLSIITGVGRHSEGRRGRIGPAVSGMLEREGWWVVYGEGVVIVTGKRR